MNLNKKIFAIIALLSVTGYSFGYTYEVSNETDKPLVVRLVERRISISDGKGDHYATLQPREKKVMKLPGLWCLKTIQARSFDTLADIPKDISTAAMLDVAMKMVSSDDKGVLDDKNTGDLSVMKKAITVLTEESLCRDRKFTLTLTGKKAEKVIGGRTITLPFDEIIATTQND